MHQNRHNTALKDDDHTTFLFECDLWALDLSPQPRPLVFCAQDAAAGRFAPERCLV